MQFPLCSLALVLGAAVVQAAPVTEPVLAPVVTEPLAERDGLRISIVPTSTEGDVGIIDLKTGSPCINVRLQNTSDKALSLYEERNSVGFYNLTLEITEVDDKVLNKTLVVRKGPMNWWANSLSRQIIKPGESLVRVARLHIPSEKDKKADLSGWLYRDFPLPPVNGTRDITMRAVFQTPHAFDGTSTLKPKESSTWLGKIASQPMNYRIQWDAN